MDHAAGPILKAAREGHRRPALKAGNRVASEPWPDTPTLAPDCGKTSGSLSCPLVAPLSRLVGMNGYNSVILCKPTLHSGKGLQGRLSYRLARTQTSLQLRVGEHLTAEPRTRVRDVAVHPEHAAEEENLRTDAVISRRLIAGGQTGCNG